MENREADGRKRNEWKEGIKMERRRREVDRKY
jgi:hypothetical protein